VIFGALGLLLRARLRIKEWLSPAQVFCAVVPEPDAAIPLRQPALSPPAGGVQVTIEEGDLRMLNTPVVTPKEVDND
jgi:hypothetical protein